MATVNLSKELLDYRGGVEAAEHLLAQLVLTLTELPDVRRCRSSWRESRKPWRANPLEKGHQRPATINVAGIKSKIPGKNCISLGDTI
jgi:hypothetical protein